MTRLIDIRKITFVLKLHQYFSVFLRKFYICNLIYFVDLHLQLDTHIWRFPITDYNDTEGRKMKHCNSNQTRNPSDICVVNKADFGPCTAANGYGYPQGKPCIFLKLNKIFGWEPEVYNAPIPSMPADLLEAINNTSVDEVSWDRILYFIDNNAIDFIAP